MADKDFLMKRWTVTVRWSSGALTSNDVIAPTRGKALADTWRSDVFNGCTFGEFLRFTTCRRAPDPEWWGAEIEVLDERAFFLGEDGQYVRFCRPGSDVAMISHPYDVQPHKWRPKAYQGSEAHA